MYPHSVTVWTQHHNVANEEKLPYQASPMPAEPLLRIPQGGVRLDWIWRGAFTRDRLPPFLFNTARYGVRTALGCPV
jgi:hypothetical protein